LLFELGKPYEVSIDCFAGTDLGIFIGKEKYEKLSNELDKIKFMMGLNRIANLKVKKKMQISGGNIYIIRGKSTTGQYGTIGEEYYTAPLEKWTRYEPLWFVSSKMREYSRG